MLRIEDDRQGRGGSQAGFSLVELLIAMVVTLIVTGAVFGLMLSGQTAFRREPDLTDRQQNIRMAMDLIQRDITTAGMGLPPSTQVFTDGLDNITTGVPTPTGGTPDELEMLGSDGSCPSLWICDQPGTVTTRHPHPSCLTTPPGSLLLVLSTGPLQGTVVWKDPAPAAGTPCPANPLGGGPGGGSLGLLPWRFGLPAANTFDEGFVTTAQAPHYQLRLDALGVPDLWRSPTGGLDQNGVDNYQLVSRGIEDLQVQYRNGNGVWTDTPGAVTCPPAAPCPPANATSVVREVRVTLTARALGANLQGGSQPTTGAARAPRGQLTSTTSPRAALFHLSQVAGPPWN
jgi:prepilin-type N-terminal cleavage/methylation domain-containing protein